MSDTWRTWLFLDDIRLEGEVAIPFDFGGVVLDTIPLWFRGKDGGNLQLDPIVKRISEEIRRSDYCLHVTYLADALGSPDPNWTGPRPRPIQNAAGERILHALLALWLTRLSPAGGSHMVHAHTHAGDPTDWICRQYSVIDSLRAREEYLDAPLFSKGDLEAARALYVVINKLERRSVLRVALESCMRAYTEAHWTIRFLIFWLAAEALFGSNNPSETTYRLSQRVALFLEPDNEAAKKLFGAMRTSYGWRSKVVHGLKLSKLTDPEADRLMSEIESVLRRSLVRILSDTTLLELFNSSERETYLDDLAFR